MKLIPLGHNFSPLSLDHLDLILATLSFLQFRH